MTDQQTTDADDMTGSKSRHPAYRQRATIDRETEARLLAEIGGAWQALPDDATGDHDTLADAIGYLVAERDELQALAAERLRSIEVAWAALRRHTNTGPHDTLADAIGALAADRGDGWRKALETVSELMAEQCDATPEFQTAYVVGLLSGLLAVDRG